MGEIEVEAPVLEGQRLSCKFNVPKEFSKYIKNDELFIGYDADITYEQSILSIPLTAIVLPLAWLTGSDVKVAKLDKKPGESAHEFTPMNTVGA